MGTANGEREITFTLNSRKFRSRPITSDITIQIFLYSWRQKFRGVRGVLVTSIKFVNHEEN